MFILARRLAARLASGIIIYMDSDSSSVMPAGLRPNVQSFILADQVYIDSRTGKKIIAGTFNHVHLGASQNSLGRGVFAYLALTNCRGRVELQLKHVDLADDRVLHRSGRIGFDADDPLQTYEIVVEIPPLPLPHEGAYALEAWCNGEVAGSIRLGVVRKAKPSQDRERGDSTGS